jgi:hypothetical protein
MTQHEFVMKVNALKGEVVDTVVFAGGAPRTVLFTAPVDITAGDTVTYDFANGRLVSVERDGRIIWKRVNNSERARKR